MKRSYKGVFPLFSIQKFGKPEINIYSYFLYIFLSTSTSRQREIDDKQTNKHTNAHSLVIFFGEKNLSMGYAEKTTTTTATATRTRRVKKNYNNNKEIDETQMT